MRNNPHAARPGHARSRIVTTRWSDAEHQELVKRAREACARTPSEYVRAATLRGRKFEVGSHQATRDLIIALGELAGAIQNSPAGPVRDQAFERAIAALDRIVS
jgi:hypothetical protein